MQLKIEDPIALMLITRLQKEIGELVVSNALLDEYCNMFQAEIESLKNTNIVLQDKVKAYQNDNNELKKQLDPSRGDRFDGPHANKRKHSTAVRDNNAESS